MLPCYYVGTGLKVGLRSENSGLKLRAQTLAVDLVLYSFENREVHVLFQETGHVGKVRNSTSSVFLYVSLWTCVLGPQLLSPVNNVQNYFRMTSFMIHKDSETVVGISSPNVFNMSGHF